MPMAICDSVTVSISDEIIGRERDIESESDVSRRVSRGRTSEYCVAKDTSSYVRPNAAFEVKNASASRKNLSSILLLITVDFPLR